MSVMALDFFVPHFLACMFLCLDFGLVYHAGSIQVVFRLSIIVGLKTDLLLW